VKGFRIKGNQPFKFRNQSIPVDFRRFPLDAITVSHISPFLSKVVPAKSLCR